MLAITREQVEDYRFLRLYSIDMEMAKQACDLLATQSDLAVQYALLRDLVVTYARPFSTNRGRTHKRHKLRDEIVPAAMKPLHAELMTLRELHTPPIAARTAVHRRLKSRTAPVIP